MKFLVAIAAFLATIALTTQTLANHSVGHKETTEKAAEHEAAPATHGEGHGESHGDLSAKMNSLFPTKQQNPEASIRPAVVSIKSPSFLSNQGAGPVKLEWNEVKGATNYHLQIATDANFKWLVVNEKFVKETTYNFTAEAGKRYFWRVASYNGDNTNSFTKSNFVSSAFNVK